jgi:PAS domain S-box-containing protein
MRRRPCPSQPPLDDYTAEMDLLHHQLAASMLRWQGETPMPPSLAEAVEELTATVEELHAINDDLAQCQQAALASQQRYQELFDGVPEAYLVTDLAGLILEANRAAATLFHLDHVQLHGLPLAVLMARESRPSFRTQLAWLRNGAEVREWVLRVQPRHRSAIPVVCQVAPARDFQGQLTGFRWLLRDLTPQQQAQEVLETRVRDLKAALEHATLRERALHHRMKNDLQVVTSLLSAQAEDLAAPRGRGLVEACQARIRAIALVHDLLHLTTDVGQLQLGAYLRQLVLQLFEVYGVDRARLHVTLHADAVSVGVDTAVPCGLLAHEVLSNCIRHISPGPQPGHIGVTLREEPAGEVTLTICGTGIGLPTDWDIRQDGSFGLRLIHGLSEQLHGALVVTHDQRTCVTFRFPIDRKAHHGYG